MRRVLADLLFDAIGSLIYAVGLSCFTAPARIAPGGVSGIAVILKQLFGVPLSVTTLALNIPLLLLAWRFLGRGFTLRTMKTVLIQTAVTQVVESYFPAYTGEPMLAALFGGVCIGVGLALVFQRGSTTGGTDIVSRLIQLRHRYLPIGKVMLLVDACVVAASVIVFRNLEIGLYALITIFASSRVMDTILAGVNRGRLMLIISDRNDLITTDIMDKLQRGVTILNGRGAYSGLPKNVLMCAVRISEYPRVTEFVRQHDPDAFIITTEASEIRGEGFAGVTDEQIT